MKFKKVLLLVAFGLLLSIFMVACSESEGGNDTSSEGSEGEEEETAAKDGKEVKQVLNLLESDVIPSMDPQLSTDAVAAIYIGNTMEGLYRKKDGKMTPGIATDHKVSEDGLTWTFTLREDAKWANGDPVTAHDFVFAWQRAVNPDVGSAYGPYMMGGVVKNATKVNEGELPVEELGVKAEGDYTFVVTLEKPTPYFLELAAFSTFYPVNQKFVEKHGEKYATSAETLLSNGPFKLENWNSTSTSWTMAKNPDYWDAESVSLEKINFDVVKDPQVGVDLYQKGEVDRAGLSAEIVDKYTSHENFKVTPEASIFWLKFNQKTTEALANVNIRKAISKSFDKKALVEEVLNDGSTVATGFVPKEFSSHPESGEDLREINGDLVTFDPEKAKELWEKGLEEIGKEKVTLEFLGGDGATTKVMNEYLANQMETNLPGLTIELKQVPFEQKLELDTNMEYEIEFYGWLPDYQDANTWLNLWVTDGANNKMGYSNPKYDKLIENANNKYLQDPVKRFEAFLEAGKTLAEDAAVAPIYQSSRAQLISPKIQGVVLNATSPQYDYKWASVAPEE